MSSLGIVLGMSQLVSSVLFHFSYVSIEWLYFIIRSFGNLNFELSVLFAYLLNVSFLIICSELLQVYIISSFCIFVEWLYWYYHFFRHNYFECLKCYHQFFRLILFLSQLVLISSIHTYFEFVNRQCIAVTVLNVTIGIISSLGITFLNGSIGIISSLGRDEYQHCTVNRGLRY